MQLDPPPQLFSQQRHIHQLQQELKISRNLNQQLKAQLQDVTQERDRLINLQQQDPIRLILQGLDDMYPQVSLNASPENLERRINFHQEKILTLQQQIRELRNYLNYKDSQFLQINKKLQSIRQNQTSFFNENNQLLLENQSLKIQKDQLIQTIQKYNQKWQKLATQINQAKIQFFQTTFKNRQELSYCQQDMDKLRNSWLRASNFLTDQEEWKKREEPNKIQQLSEKLKLQSQIMEELGRELDMRNDEISQLHKNKNKNPQMNPYDTYEHSLNNMIHSAKQRQRHYTELLKKYQSIAENYKQSIKQKQMLQNQYAKLKESYDGISDIQKENKRLRRDLQKVKQDLARSQQINLQVIDQLDCAVNQNDCYLRLMKEIHGSEVYLQRINQEKERYNESRRERVCKDLWANTAELIEMNQKLKQKLLKN